MTGAPSCSGSSPESASRWPRWLERAPALVAESLVPVSSPLAEWLRPGAPVPPERLGAELVRALLPPQAADAPPGWLRADQRLSFARALAAVRRYGGALLADPVGTGKTFIGLAVASLLQPGRPIHVLTPAALLPQWSRAGERVGLPLRLHSHERLSRGRSPNPEPGPVLIDESQRFRSPLIRRYDVLARFCLGRQGLLLSATPAVNRLEDVSHQLGLLVRDDALAWAGISSLAAISDSSDTSSLSHLVITGEDRTTELPGALRRTLRPEEPPDSPQHRLLAGILRLTLSTDPAIAGLLRTGLLLALASSPLAAAASLGRYRSLLQHARDAQASGQTVSRQTIRRLAGSGNGPGDQLVFWPLVAESGQPVDLAFADLSPAAGLERMAQDWARASDTKVQVLQQVVADRRPTLVFAHATATVEYLRRQLGKGVAWCTGEAAGAGLVELPRDDVLDWFRRRVRPEADPFLPWMLVATDVASEGLDLPLLARVVHYDLPWTAVRLEQRSGRAFRLGSRQRAVEVVHLLPPREIERQLGQERIVARKARLPARLGLASHGEEAAAWRVRASLAVTWSHLVPEAGVSQITGNPAGAVGGFRIVLSNGTERAIVLSRGKGAFGPGLNEIAELLSQAHGISDAAAPSPGRIRAVLRALAGPARVALQRANGQELAAIPSAHARALARRVIQLAGSAARARDGQRLALLGAGLRFLRRGHTAGEAREVTGWTRLPIPELLQAFRQLPETPRIEVVRIELIGVLIVEQSSR